MSFQSHKFFEVLWSDQHRCPIEWIGRALLPQDVILRDGIPLH